MFTAGGSIKDNIKLKLTVICSFKLDNGANITIPIEFLVAEKLNDWDMILGESFLGNESLNASIHNQHISLYRDNTLYNIVLFHSKPHQAIGYVKSTEDIELAPLEEKKISIYKHTDIKSGTILIENDILLKENFKLTPSVLKLENPKTSISIKNIGDRPITIFKSSNLGLIYKISEDENNESMSFNNFINILTGRKYEIQNNTETSEIGLYNSIINEYEEDELNFENDIEELIKNNKDIVYPKDAANEFQDNLTFLPDPAEKLETWSYENVNINHLN